MRSFKKVLLLCSALFFMLPRLAADEGMWLPIYLRLISGEMQNSGLHLSADDIYSINHSSIKDAIISMGGFCTAEIVSDKGLVFTNHHCGYDAIASLSTKENNLVDNGFWSSTFQEEKPVEGLYMSILQYMEDVSELVNRSDNPDATIDSLIRAVSSSDFIEAKVTSMFYGKEHYLMVYKVYRDIRLVATPPNSIGSFGGETDNWMWPRHTGDFSVFRIYTGADNEPAEYSPDNVPFQPAHHLPISVKDKKVGDFTMIMGFPGNTQRYLPVSSIENIIGVDYPIYVKALNERLRIMKKFMDKKKSVELALTSDYESLSNSRKYFFGVVDRAAKSDFLEKKKAYEASFLQWTGLDTARQRKYGSVLDDIQGLDTGYVKLDITTDYLNLAGFAPQSVLFGIQFFRLERMLKAGAPESAIDEFKKEMEKSINEHFDTYYPRIDEKILASMARLLYNGLPEDPEYRPSLFSEDWFLKLKNKGSKDRFDRMARLIRKKSILTDRKRALAFLANPDTVILENDPGMRYTNSLIGLYLKHNTTSRMISSLHEQLMATYVEGRRLFDSTKFYYPDANSTERLTYGVIKPYVGDGGKKYKAFTTHYGILAKEIPGDEEFNVDPKLKSLLVNKDFGPYAQNDTLIICFIHNTDITGGNSGSPVMDGDGNLIGLAFDGNWEGMLSDLYFDESVTRTISVDIRYVLFVIDKFGECSHIMNELDIVKN